MGRDSFKGLLAAVFLAGTPFAADAQVAERALEDPLVFPEQFNAVAGLRELADGRVMVSDGLGQQLLILNMEDGTMTRIGREGQGPREYKTPDALFPMPGDSTLLVDLGNGRLTMLGPDGSFGETMPIGQQEGGRMVVLLPRAADAEGWLYFSSIIRMAGAGAGIPDSAPVTRFDRRTRTIDTVAMVKLEDRKVKRSGGPNNRSVGITPVPLSRRDAWGVARDGSVVLVRSGDYHVEWIGPDGAVTAGHPVRYEPVRIKKADKIEYVENAARNALSIAMRVNNGRPTMSFGRGGSRINREIDRYEWPEFKAPFTGSTVRVDHQGNAWVRRSVPAGSPVVFDVFGRDGNLKERVTLPEGRNLVGFGAGVLFAIVYDDMDLVTLERYRLET